MENQTELGTIVYSIVMDDRYLDDGHKEVLISYKSKNKATRILSYLHDILETRYRALGNPFTDETCEACALAIDVDAYTALNNIIPTTNACSGAGSCDIDNVLYYIEEYVLDEDDE